MSSIDTAHEFHSNNDIIQCLSHDKAFSALHCNIRSLADFSQLFQVLPNFHKCFYNSKGKQLVNCDYQNVNSLCSRHHYVNSLC